MKSDNKSTEKKKQKNPSNIKIIVFSLIIGIIIGYLLSFITIPTFKNRNDKSDQNAQDFSEMRSGGYQFTNPLLDCDNFHPSLLKSHVSLENDLNDYVENAIKNGEVKDISVYFRSMNNGPWIGIKENDYYSPASLLKVPFLIAAYKKAETDSNFLNEKILYSAVFDSNYKPNIVGEKSLQLGQTYTVEKILEYMIIYSDNEAKELIVKLLGDDYIVKVMTDLGVNLKGRDLSVDFITIKEYSSFFRIMYNASYLNRDMSEKALKMLSQTEFNDGIPAKLPKNILISHKFGERGLENSTLKQLHDCGIVYFPDSPYLLCIMTRGSDFNKLKNVISDISEIVYKRVSEK